MLTAGFDFSRRRAHHSIVLHPSIHLLLYPEVLGGGAGGYPSFRERGGGTPWTSRHLIGGQTYAVETGAQGSFGVFGLCQRAWMGPAQTGRTCRLRPGPSWSGRREPLRRYNLSCSVVRVLPSTPQRPHPGVAFVCQTLLNRYLD